MRRMCEGPRLGQPGQRKGKEKERRLGKYMAASLLLKWFPIELFLLSTVESSLV